jgi:hypothetical protein
LHNVKPGITDSFDWKVNIINSQLYENIPTISPTDLYDLLNFQLDRSSNKWPFAHGSQQVNQTGNRYLSPFGIYSNEVDPHIGIKRSEHALPIAYKSHQPVVINMDIGVISIHRTQGKCGKKETNDFTALFQTIMKGTDAAAPHIASKAAMGDNATSSETQDTSFSETEAENEAELRSASVESSFEHEGKDPNTLMKDLE